MIPLKINNELPYIPINEEEVQKLIPRRIQTSVPTQNTVFSKQSLHFSKLSQQS
jgi:hypothetical protein